MSGGGVHTSEYLESLNLARGMTAENAIEGPISTTAEKARLSAQCAQLQRRVAALEDELEDTKKQRSAHRYDPLSDCALWCAERGLELIIRKIQPGA